MDERGVKSGEWGGWRGANYPASFQKKSRLGVTMGKERMGQYAREGCIRCLVRVTTGQENSKQKEGV